MKALRSAAIVADQEYGTMPAQGIAVMTTPAFAEFLGDEDFEPEHAFAPNFPEFFDKDEVESGFPPSWPSTSRSIQNAEGSIVDSFVRTIFGWRPNWKAAKLGEEGGGGEVDVKKAIDACLWMNDVSRGDFEGILKNLRTPFGRMIDLKAGKDGVKWEWAS